MTAHAHVTINGQDSGIYVMREPINRDFLTRNATAPTTGRTAVDGKRFADYRPVIEAFINAGGTTNTARLP